MKALSILAMSLMAANALAVPEAMTTPKASKVEAKGLYVGNSTPFQGLSRTTYALIENNGEIWSTDFYVVTWNHLFVGKINKKTGDGSAIHYNPGPATIINYYPAGLNSLSLTTAITPQSIQLRVTSAVPQVNPPFHAVNPLANYPGIPADTWPVEVNRAPYDYKLELQPEENVEKNSQPKQVTDLAKRIHINMGTNGKFTGSDGTCNFEGKVNSSDGYKKVSLKYQNDCFRAGNTNDNSERKVSKGTEAEGVYFNAFRFVAAPNVNPFGYNCILSSTCPKEPAGIMILHTKKGTEFGTAFMFNSNAL